MEVNEKEPVGITEVKEIPEGRKKQNEEQLALQKDIMKKLSEQTREETISARARLRRILDEVMDFSNVDGSKESLKDFLRLYPYSAILFLMDKSIDDATFNKVYKFVLWAEYSKQKNFEKVIDLQIENDKLKEDKENEK